MAKKKSKKKKNKKDKKSSASIQTISHKETTEKTNNENKKSHIDWIKKVLPSIPLIMEIILYCINKPDSPIILTVPFNFLIHIDDPNLLGIVPFMMHCIVRILLNLFPNGIY